MDPFDAFQRKPFVFVNILTIRNCSTLHFIGSTNGYRPYVSNGISQQIRPTYGRRKRSAQNGFDLTSRRYGSYGNSYNKAGICPLYGRKRRSSDNVMEEVKHR